MRKCKLVTVSLFIVLGLTYLGYNIYDGNVLVLLKNYVTTDICQKSQICSIQCTNCEKESKKDRQDKNLITTNYGPITKAIMANSKNRDMTSRKQNFRISHSDVTDPNLLHTTKNRENSKINEDRNKKINKNVQRVFEHIAVHNVWKASNETRSGTGSLLSATVTMRECLGEWIKKYNITSIVDIPCGDGNWQRYIPGIDKISYRGFDISTFVINIAKKRNPPNMKYGVLDLTSNVPPKADLIIMRDVIQHLPLRLGKQAILNARRSGVKWIAVSSYPTAFKNKEISTGGYYKNNVQISPFYLTNIVETCDNYSGYIKKNYLDAKFLLIKSNDTLV